MNTFEGTSIQFTTIEETPRLLLIIAKEGMGLPNPLCKYKNE